MSILLAIGAIVFFFCALTPYIPYSSIVTDLPSHFVLQYAVCAPLFFLIAVYFKVPKPALVLVVMGFILSALQLWPYMPLSSRAEAMRTAGHTLKILQINVHNENNDVSGFLRLIEKENPDIIAVAETHGPFLKAFAGLKAQYPHQHYRDSVALLSRFGLDQIAAPQEGSIEPLAFTLTEKNLTLLTFHTPNPFQSLRLRDLEIKTAADWIKNAGKKNIILLGDINATSYCPGLLPLTRGAGLVNARTGRGVMGSFPSWLPAFMRIPIDHVLVSPSIAIMNYKIGDSIGSDHLPTIAEIKI